MRSLRHFLVWLLVLALPIQGAAAAVMASCGPGHHGAASAESAVRSTQSSQPLSAHPSTVVDHDRHAHHEHQADPDPAQAHPSDSADDSASGDTGNGTQKKCSACASCCSMTALPNPVSAMPTADSTPAVFCCVVPRIDPYASDGPDRPPRTDLA